MDRQEEKPVSNITKIISNKRNRKALYTMIELSLIAIMVVDAAPFVVPVSIAKGYRLWKLSKLLTPAKKVLMIAGRIIRRWI